MTSAKYYVLFFLVCLLSACVQHTPTKNEWHKLFNGHDLSGWSAKIYHHELGDNFADTFRVENGLLRVCG
ncbi:hypothetical protein FX988_01839 [Paraglaciecola mesophila]|uniref:3-keto-disaccharide hydrolase domain-containing protein n=1 Tax=Paraglaciecola mesophila TaxID=197222 RepID=A0A857JHV5_9ALTE|nr:hypothetical protein [Paraglaciecola mesophila]QHJ11605.1 hypothetical protein FX988_01839 [Paraglaciecola mesophila]